MNREKNIDRENKQRKEEKKRRKEKKKIYYIFKHLFIPLFAIQLTEKTKPK
jgi:hypothetical protein